MVGPHSIEVVMHVAEVADVAWTALGRHREHVAIVKEFEKEHIGTEEALALERVENEKLRAAIEVYENAIQEELDRQGSAHSLSESLSLARDGSFDLHDQLRKRVESPAFLEKLEGIPPFDDETVSQQKKLEGSVVAEDPNLWQWINDTDMHGLECKEEKDGLDSEGYVVVNQDDFVDGMATFLAKYISSMPEAKRMTPKDLQKTLVKAFTSVEKKGKLRRIWETGKLLYTATSWGATVFGLYRHPVVMQAASMALWTTCSLIIQLLK